jgi:hypothetical protein
MRELITDDLIFARTSLGEGVFIHSAEIDARNGIRPSEWTPEELRAMADYMEANPNCTLFEDGSGEACLPYVKV